MRIRYALAPLAAAMILAGCGNRDTAQSVLSQAQGAIDERKETAAMIAPDQLKTTESQLAAMQADFKEGEYDAVLAEVPDFNKQIEALDMAVATQQGAVASATTEWTTISQDVPKSVEAIEKRVQELSAGGAKLPKDVTKETVATAKTEVETIKTEWASAEADAQAGNTLAATEKGKTLQQKANDLKTQLGIVEEQPAALASAPAGTEPTPAG
jgi:chromosome segregation ATPase